MESFVIRGDRAEGREGRGRSCWQKIVKIKHVASNRHRLRSMLIPISSDLKKERFQFFKIVYICACTRTENSLTYSSSTHHWPSCHCFVIDPEKKKDITSGPNDRYGLLAAFGSIIRCGGSWGSSGGRGSTVTGEVDDNGPSQSHKIECSQQSLNSPSLCVVLLCSALTPVTVGVALEYSKMQKWSRMPVTKLAEPMPWRNSSYFFGKVVCGNFTVSQISNITHPGQLIASMRSKNLRLFSPHSWL